MCIWDQINDLLLLLPVTELFLLCLPLYIFAFCWTNFFALNNNAAHLYKRYYCSLFSGEYFCFSQIGDTSFFLRLIRFRNKGQLRSSEWLLLPTCKTIWFMNHNGVNHELKKIKKSFKYNFTTFFFPTDKDKKTSSN